MPEPRLSLESLKHACPTCGGPLPCSLHNRALREALLHREIESPPYERLEVLGTYTDARGNAQDILTLHPLPDSAVLVGGDGGPLKRLNPDGSWKDLGTYTDARGNAQNIWTLHPLPDGAVLVGGWGGSLKRLNPDGSWEDLGTYTDARGNAQNIWTLHPLPDGAVLVGGSGGFLERWGQDPASMQRYREQVLAQKRGEIPPMPEEPMV